MSAGRVGRPHGRDGSFYVEGVDHPLPEGATLELAGRERRVERRAGTDERPLIRLAGLDDPRPLRGEPLLVEAELGDGEWLAGELARCRVEGLGAVARVVEAPSCDLLELENGVLVPLVGDAVRSVDLARGVIEVDFRFLGLER